MVPKSTSQIKNTIFSKSCYKRTLRVKEFAYFRRGVCTEM